MNIERDVRYPQSMRRHILVNILVLLIALGIGLHVTYVHILGLLTYVAILKRCTDIVRGRPRGLAMPAALTIINFFYTMLFSIYALHPTPAVLSLYIVFSAFYLVGLLGYVLSKQRNRDPYSGPRYSEEGLYWVCWKTTGGRMPSWKTHWAVAKLLGYEPCEEVERLVDGKPLHDLGITVVREPLEPLETSGAVKRKRMFDEALRALNSLRSRHRLFYLHHAIDDLFERTKSSIIVGRELQRNAVIHGIRIDLEDIHSRIEKELRIDFPSPPDELFERLYQKFDDVVKLLIDEAKEKVRVRLRYENCIPWVKAVRNCVTKHIKSVENHIKGCSRYWRPEKVFSMAKEYLLGRACFCIAIEAAKRSRFYDYALVYGAPLRAL